MKRIATLMIAAASTSFFIGCTGGDAENNDGAIDSTSTAATDTTTAAVVDPAPTDTITSITDVNADTTVTDTSALVDATTETEAE